MCLALSSKGKLIEREHLLSGYESNQHGMGFAFSKDGKLTLKKGFFDFEEFYEAYKECENNPHIAHARFATAGLKNAENTHPFIVAQNENGEPTLVMIHNGCITGFSHKTKDMSDTFSFVSEILTPLHNDVNGKKWYQNSGLRWLLESAISTNKLVFLDNEGNIEIFNEDLGEYIDEEKTIWASNSMWKTKKVRSSTVINQQYTEYSKYMGGYESDYMTGDNITNNTDKNDKKTDGQSFNSHSGSSSATVDIWNDVGPEELKEIDSYLDELNAVN